MTTPRPGTPRDDLTVARRAHARARERTYQFRLELHDALRALEEAAEALKKGDAHEIHKAMRSARDSLEGYATRGVDSWTGEARIDGKIKDHPWVGPETHRFLGMWRPPSPPDSPQKRGCSAIICRCLVELGDEAQVRQHWDTGCFDLPEYETVPDWDEELEDVDAPRG
jgi:hypothetical protein